MNIELIPNNWKNLEIPTPTITICEYCCGYYSLEEGKEYLSLFARHPFIGIVGSMNVIIDTTVQVCMSCENRI